MASSVAAAQEALRDALRAQSGLAGVLIGDLSTEVPTETERLYLTGMEGYTRTRVAQQRIYREEFTLPLIVEVHDSGRGEDVRDAVKARAWVIFDILDELLDDDETLDCEVTSAEVLEIRSEITLPTTEGWITQLTPSVRVVVGPPDG